MSNLYDHIASIAGRFPDRPAVEVQRPTEVDRVSYSQLLDMADRMAGWLATQGCGQGDRCALLAENDAHWCAAYLAILRLGAIAVPFDTNYRAAQVATLLDDSRPRVLLTSPRCASLAAQALGALAADGCFPALLRGPAEPFTSLEPILTGGGPRPVLPASRAATDDPAVILYTSGTTSDPKGVVLTHGNLLAEREAAFQAVSVTEHDCILGVLPLFHALALLANLLLPLSVGARVVFLESVNTTELLRAFTERDVTAFCCVPQFFYLIHQRVRREAAAAGPLERLAFRVLLAVNGWLRDALRLNLGRFFFRRVHDVLGSKMRILVTGGSRFDPIVGREFYRMGFDILQAYGLTECSGAATITRPGDSQFESVGRPLPGIDIRILSPSAKSGDRDEFGSSMPASTDPQVGEIAIRGPIVMAGYYQRPGATAMALEDGWLRTGDLGYLDRTGRLHITGRRKDVIVLASGKNIYPEEVETHYLQSATIKELCVLGVVRPNEPTAERLHAVVVPDVDLLRERRIVNMRELLRFEIEGLSVLLPSHKRIQGFEIRIDPLPRTTTGKLQRFEIRRRHEAEEAARRARATPPWDGVELAWAADSHAAAALEAIRTAVQEPAAVRPSANLELDLGLDSMERVELLTRLEQHFATRVATEVVPRILTVRELVEAVRPSGDVHEAPSVADPWSHLLAMTPEDPELEELLKPKRVLAPALFLFVRTLCALVRLVARIEVSGRDHLPPDDPCIVSPNHQSYLDAFLIGAVLPFRTFRRVFFVGASEYFESRSMRALGRAINVVPVDPDTNLVRAMQAGAFGLRHGKVLVLFPEGERSIDGEPKAFKKGAAILSAHLEVPILPVALDGLFELWPRTRSFQWRRLVPWRRPLVQLRFGPPVPVPAPPVMIGGPIGTGWDAVYAATAARLRETVVTMWRDLGKRTP